MKLLDADAINRMANYLVTQVDEYSVRFVTKDGVRYLVGFYADIFILDDNGYWLYVVNENEPQKRDPKVAQTISTIIRNLFENIDKSVALYVCAQDDNRQAARAKMFKSWFSCACFNEQFLLETHESNDNGKMFYYGLIMRQDNPDKEYIIKTFNDFLG